MSEKIERFDGSDIVHNRDASRLTDQLGRIKYLMTDGKWRTLQEIANITGDPPASVSAQLRNLRKVRFGSHIIEKQYLGNGLFHYRLIIEETDT